MIMNSRQKNVEAKQEGETIDRNNNIPKISSTSRQWAGFKNPRIVRVSRAFGGKDRHSKVCTIRGLRDRRIRLSVPTAIQLYDLQDRLGLSQPSKVVDWLLDATKAEIDKLPPLQLPPGSSFSQFHPPGMFPQASGATQASMSHLFTEGDDQGSRYSPSEALMRAKNKETHDRETAYEKGKWNSSNDQENMENFGGYVAQLSAQNFFPLPNQPSFPGLLNSPFPYNSYFHFEPPNLSLSQFGNHMNSHTLHTEDSQNNTNNSLPLQPSLAIPSCSQLYICPSVSPMPSILPQYPPIMNPVVDTEPRQISPLQLLSSSSQHGAPSSLMPTLHLISPPMKSFSLNMSPKVNSSQENGGMNKGGGRI